jgi:hypothetical protein
MPKTRHLYRRTFLGHRCPCELDKSSQTKELTPPGFARPGQGHQGSLLVVRHNQGPIERVARCHRGLYAGASHPGSGFPEANSGSRTPLRRGCSQQRPRGVSARQRGAPHDSHCRGATSRQLPPACASCSVSIKQPRCKPVQVFNWALYEVVAMRALGHRKRIILCQLER